MTPEAASRDRREPWEPLSANELRDLREQPVVNRNGSTGNLVDRLIATVDLAWAEIGHLRLAASQPSPSAVPEALRLCVYCNTDQFACREWNRVEKVCCPDCTHNDAALPPSAPEDIEVLIERLCSEALGHIAKAASSKAWKRGAESAVEWFRMALTQVLASSPVAPTEGLARELADAAQAFLDWEVAGHMGMGHPAVPERTRLRNALAALATPGIAALPALDEKRLARAWTTHYGSHPNLDCGPFCADDLAAEYLATTTEETTDG